MNNLTDIARQVYTHLQQNARYRDDFGVVCLPTVSQTTRALKLNKQEVEESYQELLEEGVIREFSQFLFTIGFNFSLLDKTKWEIKMAERSSLLFSEQAEAGL